MSRGGQTTSFKRENLKVFFKLVICPHCEIILPFHKRRLLLAVLYGRHTLLCVFLITVGLGHSYHILILDNIQDDNAPYTHVDHGQHW